jgi:hypothetical protein
MKTMKAGLHAVFAEAEAHHAAGPVLGEHAVRSLRFDELELHHRGIRVVDPGHASARERFQGNQRQRRSPSGVAMAREPQGHLPC